MILYEFLTGRPAYDVSGPLMAVIRRIGDSELPSPRKFCPTLEHDLESIVMKAVSLRPESRYRSVEDFGQDLRNYLSGQALIARSPSPGYLLRQWLLRHRRSVTALITIGCLAVAGIGYHFQTLHSEGQRIKAEAAEHLAVILPKSVVQHSAGQVVVNPGLRNGSPVTSNSNSLFAAQSLLNSLFQSGDPVSIEAGTTTSPIRYSSGNRIGDGVAGVRQKNSS